MTPPRPLDGWRVLVPRGGDWGETVASHLRRVGAKPVIAPLINFAPASDQAVLDAAFERLQQGAYDWLVVTSATTVDVLAAMRVVLPESTRVAAVGETTALALRSAGYRCDFVPTNESSTLGLVNELPLGAGVARRILLPESEIAELTLVGGLRRLGHHVDQVTAYRTVGVPASEELVREVAEGDIRAILVTSGSVAREVGRQFGEVPEEALIVCIGPRTAHDAIAAGLPVDVIARERSVDSLIEALLEAARPRPVYPPTGAIDLSELLGTLGPDDAE